MTSRRAPALFNWAGSKARVAKAICAFDLTRFGTYHEPFLGSGAAVLAMASAGLISKSMLSDANHWLVNVFRATQAQPQDVVAVLRMHALLDSDVHFSSVLGRLNSNLRKDVTDFQAAADTIYLLSQSFHSTWYETRDGQVSMSRRRDADPFRARPQDVIRVSALLKDATIQCVDFREALDRVQTGDLVFLDPPYLYGDDQVDQQSYNANRFSVRDVQFLSAEIKRMLGKGAHVIFCWGERVDAVVPKHGCWKRIGRDYVWISEGLALGIDSAGSSAAALALGGN